MSIQLIVEPDAAAASRKAAALTAEIIKADPSLAAVFATGNSPMALYSELARMYREGTLDTRSIRAFQLDSYLGTPDDDPRSLYGWMDRAVLKPLSIEDRNVVRFAEHVDDHERECAVFHAKIIAAGGFDLSILGLGPNGHLGFNEPPSDASATTRMVPLTPESISSNAAYWGGVQNVPTLSLTVGMDTLLASRQTLLIVTGAHKHSILRSMIEGPVTPEVPASFLQTASRVVVVADEAAWTGKAIDD